MVTAKAALCMLTTAQKTCNRGLVHVQVLVTGSLYLVGDVLKHVKKGS